MRRPHCRRPRSKRRSSSGRRWWRNSRISSSDLKRRCGRRWSGPGRSLRYLQALPHFTLLGYWLLLQHADVRLQAAQARADAIEVKAEVLEASRRVERTASTCWSMGGPVNRRASSREGGGALKLPQTARAHNGNMSVATSHSTIRSGLLRSVGAQSMRRQR